MKFSYEELCDAGKSGEDKLHGLRNICLFLKQNGWDCKMDTLFSFLCENGDESIQEHSTQIFLYLSSHIGALQASLEDG